MGITGRIKESWSNFTENASRLISSFNEFPTWVKVTVIGALLTYSGITLGGFTLIVPGFVLTITAPMFLAWLTDWAEDKI